jgi:trimethylamine--corrinoid protein Co-methyltransferase
VSDAFRPYAVMIAPERVDAIIEESIRILEEVGLAVEHEGALELLRDAGATVSSDGRVHLPSSLCRRCLETVPNSFTLYDRSGENPRVVGSNHVHFDPGSAALSLYDAHRGEIRSATTRDVVQFAILTEQMRAYRIQSTGVVPGDLAAALSDRFRLLIALAYGTKPVVTGTFVRDGFSPMRAMLEAVRGGADALARKPLAIFDCCPTAPLMWSELTCDALISCARAKIPAEVISMPLPGAAAPVTLAGAITQHAAENLSGVVIHQLASPGAPIVYGGAPAVFDMRKATTPMGAVETMMIDAAYARVGKRLGLPVHAYMALSDAKQPDFQAGFETAMGATLAALCGVNIASGPGMLSFSGTQSLEKLVLDEEICAMADRLLAGIAFREPTAALEVLKEHAIDRSFITSPHTRKYYREECYFPSELVDRGTQAEWEAAGKPDALRRAKEKVAALLEHPRITPPPSGLLHELEAIMVADARAHGVERLPDWKFALEG